MPYGTIKVDNIIYTKGGVDTTLTVSGIVDSLSGAISVTGSISGASVSATTGTFTTLSGNTTAGTTATFVTGVFTTSLSGATITGNTGQFSNITGVSGVFTTRISGATITGNTGQFGSITGISGIFTSVSGTTFTVTSGVFASGTAAAPSVSVGTTTNGLYSSATNQIAVTTSGTSRLIVDDLGNVNIDSGTFYVDAVNNRVGIGTTSPGQLFHVSGGYSLLNGLRISGADTSNSIYQASAFGLSSGDYISFSTNSAGPYERARIDSSGRLLVGTSDGSGGVSKLVIQGASNGSAVGVAQISYNGLASAGLAADTDIGYLRFTDQGSNSGVFAQITATADATTGASDYPGRLVFSTTADGAASPTERMRITNAGRVQINDTVNANNFRLSVVDASGSGPVAGFANSSTGSSLGGISSAINAGGNNTNSYHFRGVTETVSLYYLYGNGTHSYTSDARKKKNIETTRDGYLEDLNKLRVVKYNWFNHDDDAPKELGLIAQEVEEVFPGLVQEADQLEGDDFKCKVLKGSVLPVMLLKALQEATARIEQLETKVAALESR